MKHSQIRLLALFATLTLLCSACGGPAEDASNNESAKNGDGTESPSNSQVASSNQMAPVEDVVRDGMVPVYGESLKDGVYDVAVDSSSSMFKIASCELTVSGGEMTAVLHMGGTG